jgi:peptidoglycan/LPS O-acetylase OafA/YrhL
MNRRTQELTGLRCVAVTLVIISHAERMTTGGYSGWLAPLRLLTDGRLGVLIFFVLSGFLITDLLQREWNSTGKINLPAFYLRRALRIWPAFYTYVIVVSLLGAAGILDIDYRQTLYAAAHLWNYSGLLGLASTNAAHPEGAWYLGHFWTLALEEQFYWFWPPVLLYCLARKDSRPLVFLILLVPIIRMATYFGAPSLRGQLLMMLHTGVDPILVGCYAGMHKEKLQRMLGALPNGSLILSVLVLTLFLVMPMADRRLGGYWIASYGRTIEAAMAATLIIALTAKADFWLSRLLRTRVFVAVGTVSFSLYLWQQLFFNVATPFALRFPLCIAEALAAATLSYWLIEQPFLRLKDSSGRTSPHPMDAAPVDPATAMVVDLVPTNNPQPPAAGAL